MNRLPVKYPLRFHLVDAETQKTLGEFKARNIRDRQWNANFEGGNIASGGHSMSIATPKNLGFVPYQQQVVDLDFGFTYMIVQARILMHETVGRSYCRAAMLKEVVLELE